MKYSRPAPRKDSLEMSGCTADKMLATVDLVLIGSGILVTIVSIINIILMLRHMY